MELVYLWVEEYKNIYRQGFNFSPRFRCDYKAVYTKDKKGNEVLDEEQSKLIIEENNDYIPSFFGENINITAIVGKNGSGKSNLIELIQRISINNTFTIGLFVDNKSEFKCFTSYFKSINIVNKTILEIEKIVNFNDFLEYYRKNYWDKIVYLYLKTFLDIYQSKEFKLYMKRLDRIFNGGVVKKDLETFLIEARQNLISMNTIKTAYLEELEYIFLRALQNFYNLIGRYYLKIESFLEKYLYIKNITFSIKSIEEIYKYNPIYKEKMNNEKILELNQLFNKINNPLDKIKVLAIINFCIYNEEILNFCSKFKVELELYDNIISHFQDEHIGSWNLLISSFNLLHTDPIKFYKIYDEFYFNVKQDLFTYNFYPPLSSGQEKILFLLLQIFDFLYNKYDFQKKFFIVIDEGENLLHPSWQKDFISILVNFINSFFKDIKIHIILTTHSPFLLSDIPKQNIIFLDRDKNGNCKVVEGLKEKKQTFGANIHTLLSDSFFMEDGLMGEFAKEKIENVIKFLKDEESVIQNKEEAKKIIDIIGEPFIRDKLLYMYKEKFPISKEDKIKELEEELKRLKGD